MRQREKNLMTSTRSGIKHINTPEFLMALAQTLVEQVNKNGLEKELHELISKYS